MWRNWTVTFASSLPLTGERTVPGVAREAYWFARHEVVYQWVAAQLRATVSADAVVVDAGCGEGYGAALLRRQLLPTAPNVEVVGLDYDEATAAHVHRAHPQVRSVRANLAQFPLPAGSCAALVSLQVIEHLWDLGGFLHECRRILDDQGVAVVSTPNRPVFSPGLGRGEKPTNPFHVEEFDAEQVHGMLSHAGFRDVAVFGVHHGPTIRAWEERNGPIVAAQIDAALSDRWPAELEAFLPQVSAADFEIGEPGGAADLIGVGRR